MPKHAPSPWSNEEIAARLELTRGALGLTQAAFARRLGVTQQQYTNWKQLRARVSLDVAIQICQAIGVDLDWIYRGGMRELDGDLAAKIQKLRAERRSA